MGESRIMRYKFFAIGYAIGYFISFTITGVPDWKYFIPIKLLAFLFAFTVGNVLYYVVEEKDHIFSSTFRTIKYVIPSIILLVIFSEFQAYLYAIKGVDLGFITGFTN